MRLKNSTKVWKRSAKVIQGQLRPLLCQNHSSPFVYGPIFIKICMNANIMKTQFSINYTMSLLCNGEGLWFLILRPSDLITTLTYVLRDNFYPFNFLRKFCSIFTIQEHSPSQFLLPFKYGYFFQYWTFLYCSL